VCVRVSICVREATTLSTPLLPVTGNQSLSATTRTTVVALISFASSPRSSANKTAPLLNHLPRKSPSLGLAELFQCHSNCHPELVDSLPLNYMTMAFRAFGFFFFFCFFFGGDAHTLTCVVIAMCVEIDVNRLIRSIFMAHLYMCFPSASLPPSLSVPLQPSLSLRVYRADKRL